MRRAALRAFHNALDHNRTRNSQLAHPWLKHKALHGRAVGAQHQHRNLGQRAGGERALQQMHVRGVCVMTDMEFATRATAVAAVALRAITSPLLHASTQAHGHSAAHPAPTRRPATASAM